MYRFLRLFAPLLCVCGAFAQAPNLTGYYTAALIGQSIGPGTPLIVLGTFTFPAAGRDYSITVGGVTTGINVAASNLFITVTVPPTVSPGDTTLVISHLGAASNALPIHVAPLAPEFSGRSYTAGSVNLVPTYGPYLPFTHATGSNAGKPVTAVSPAVAGEFIQSRVDGIGMDFPPAVTPTVTVGTETANLGQVSGSGAAGPGFESILFQVPSDAPAGILPVVTTIAGVNSNTATIPVGTVPLIGSVLNGASFRSPGVVAPGEIVSIFGAGFGTADNLAAFPSTTVNGLMASFAGTAAPVFALSATGGQINVLIPTELPSSGTVDLTIHDAGGVSAAQTLNLVPAAPGMFVYGDPLSVSRRNAVAVTANTAWIAMPLSMASTYGLPTNCAALGPAKLCVQPAHPGDFLQIYATGLGVATPGGKPDGAVLPTGSLAPVSGSPLYQTVITPIVTIGGVNAPVLFSGLAPGYNGLYQVDVQIPAGITSGDDVSITLAAGTVVDTATVAIK